MLRWKPGAWATICGGNRSTLSVTGEDGRTVDNALFVVSRGLEQTGWWSVYKLGSGRHLFDTCVPLLSFSILRETVTTCYVGFEAPPALLTCDDPKQAQLLRSYTDTSRAVSWVEGADQPSRRLKLSFSQNYPSPPGTVEVRLPVRRDDLDPAHAQLAPRMHLSFWRR